MDSQSRYNLRHRTKLVNNRLHVLGLGYHDLLPIAQIDLILTDNGFQPTEPAIYCGADSKFHEPVGDGKYLTITWHKMESGRYEVTAYVN